MQNLVILLVGIATFLVVLWIAGRLWGETPDHPAHPPVPTRRFWKTGAYLALVAGVVVGLIFLAVGLWGAHGYGSPRADRWLNVMMGLGGAAAAMAFLGGAYLAARYGRRASISITAAITELPGGDVLIAARPVVNAVGIFRVKFHGPGGAVIRAREVYAVEPAVSPTGLWEGEFRLAAAVFGEDSENQQFAESGEALKTTVLFRLPVPNGVIGWMVVVSVKAPTRWTPWASGAWGDKVFLARPEPKEVVP